MSMERSIPPHKCKEYLEAYSITVSNFQHYIIVTAQGHKAMHVTETYAVRNVAHKAKCHIAYGTPSLYGRTIHLSVLYHEVNIFLKAYNNK